MEHTEPVAQTEPPEGTFLFPTKKRKRQKEADGTEEVDGIGADSQPQVIVEAQEETILLSPTKKRRKEKRQNLGLPWAPKTPKPTYRNTLIPVSSRDMILISFPSLWQIPEQTV